MNLWSKHFSNLSLYNDQSICLNISTYCLEDWNVNFKGVIFSDNFKNRISCFYFSSLDWFNIWCQKQRFGFVELTYWCKVFKHQKNAKYYRHVYYMYILFEILFENTYISSVILYMLCRNKNNGVIIHNQGSCTNHVDKWWERGCPKKAHNIASAENY